ncbi:MAG: DUF3237 domain-containing protein [Deltaproteobacteria bacterium]|nr:MAG: DUF3237 domain-containing protein [Deltaproteobacteria bacterium]
MSVLRVPEGPPHLVPLFEMSVDLAAPEIIGPVPEGVRMNLYVTGGWFRGERISGKVLPVGGDWLTLRADGVGQLDVRATVETDDGALVYTWYSGLLYLGEEQRRALERGEMPGGPFRLVTAPMYRTADSRYAWLNQVMAVGRGWSDGSTVEYRVFAVDPAGD